MQTITPAYKEFDSVIKSYADKELYEVAARVIRMTHNEVCFLLQKDAPDQDIPSQERLTYLKTVDNNTLALAVATVGRDIRKALSYIHIKK